MAQKAGFLGLSDGDIQTMDGQGIFSAAVYVAMAGADGLGRDDHALQNRVRIRFQNAAVHESTGVAFVGIA
ncbi:MAG: hypothetical protein BWX99_01031 [Deltaproteobacteria bacterium ADurb.Bin151]|nr:MAG: hypothetical protein BWX99_01031 [Deltaproteobacteria bacterium ADurb.Bin151]